MSDATFTFRVEEELKSAFGEAAKAEDRTGAQLLRGFMRDYVKHRQERSVHDAWFENQVRAGLASADAGDLLSAEEVEAEFVARRAETLRRTGR